MRAVSATSLDTSNMSRDQMAQALLVAIDTRNAEIDRFWSRSLFFWGLVAATFVAFADLQGADRWHARVLIASFGLIASLGWTLQNRGAKYWQEAWEQKVAALEEGVLGTALFHNIEPVRAAGWFGPARYSVSRIAIMLSDAAVLVWAMLLADQAKWGIDLVHGDWLVGVVINLTVAAMLVVLAFGRSGGGRGA